MPIGAADVVASLQDALRERALLLETPALAWQVPRLEATTAKILGAVSKSPTATDPVIDGYRATAAAVERGFDLGHRYAYRAFTLARLGMAADAGRVIELAMKRLWPQGLDVTQLSHAQEANATPAFAAALEHEEVRAALALVAPHAPKAEEYLTLAVTSGRSLGEALRQIDVAVAGGREGSALFEARREGLSVLAYLRVTLDQLWPAGTPENDARRARLVGTYEQALAAERTAAPSPTPPPVA